MSQMFLFNNLMQGTGLLKVGVNPACTGPGQDSAKGCAGTETIKVGLPLE